MPQSELPPLSGAEGPPDCSPLPGSRCSTDTENQFENSSPPLRRAHRWPSACRAAGWCCGWGGWGASKHLCLGFCVDSGRENRTRSGCIALLPWRHWGGIDSADLVDTCQGRNSWSGEESKEKNHSLSEVKIQSPTVLHFYSDLSWVWGSGDLWRSLKETTTLFQY